MNGHKLYPGSDKVIEQAIENNVFQGNSGLLIVKDNVLFDNQLAYMDFIGNYVDGKNKEETEEALANLISYQGDYMYKTKIKMESSSLGIKVVTIFTGIYLGLTFAISSATVLAIGQLSETSDNKERYRVLRKIGADEKLINKGLFIQIGIVFIFPLIVALIHSIVALIRLNNLLMFVGNVNLSTNIFLTTIFMLILYGGYFLVTYFTSKRIIKD